MGSSVDARTEGSGQLFGLRLMGCADREVAFILIYLYFDRSPVPDAIEKDLRNGSVMFPIT
jgi:hypothetical protein